MPATWGRMPVWWFQRMRECSCGVLAHGVLGVLAAHASKKTGECYPSIDTIASTLRVTEKRVQNAIAELKAAGLIKVRGRNRRLGETNVYALAIHGEPFRVPESSTQKELESGAQSRHLIEAGDAGDSGSIGAHFDTDQVPDSAPNQISGSCSNRADNRPVEPTIEPSVLYVPGDALSRAPIRNGKKSDGTEAVKTALTEALSSCQLNGSSPEHEAERLLRLFPVDATRRLIGHARYAAAERLERPVEYIIEQTRYGANAPAVGAA